MPICCVRRLVEQVHYFRGWGLMPRSTSNVDRQTKEQTWLAAPLAGLETHYWAFYGSIIVWDLGSFICEVLLRAQAYTKEEKNRSWPKRFHLSYPPNRAVCSLFRLAGTFLWCRGECLAQQREGACILPFPSLLQIVLLDWYYPRPVVLFGLQLSP